MSFVCFQVANSSLESRHASIVMFSLGKIRLAICRVQVFDSCVDVGRYLRDERSPETIFPKAEGKRLVKILKFPVFPMLIHRKS